MPTCVDALKPAMMWSCAICSPNGAKCSLNADGKCSLNGAKCSHATCSCSQDGPRIIQQPHHQDDVRPLCSADCVHHQWEHRLTHWLTNGSEHRLSLIKSRTLKMEIGKHLCRPRTHTMSPPAARRASTRRTFSLLFREHSENIQGTFREHSGNIQITLRPTQRRVTIPLLRVYNSNEHSSR